MGIKMYKTKLYPYLSGDQLVTAGRDVVVTISHAKIEEVASQRGKEQEVILYFKETDKGMILNKTNSDRIIAITGSDDTDDWKDTKIALTFESGNWFGEHHNALRVISVHEAKTKAKKSNPAPDNQPALIENAPEDNSVGAYA